MSDAETTAAKTTAANKVVDLDQQLHDRRDVELLYRIYVDKRINSQADFYKSRVRENQSNANFTFTFSTAVMTLSAFVATVSAVISSPIFSLMSAILPALAALLAAFRQLYGWERQISIYQDALMGLERVKLMTPDKDRMPLADLASIYPQLVTGGEEVFTGEVNQWGQFVQNADKQAAEDTTDERVTNALMSDLQLSDEQIETIRKIVAAGAPKPAFSSQHTITVHPEETSALPAGAANSVSAQAEPATNQGGGSAPVTITSTHSETSTFFPVESVTQHVETDADASAQAAPAISVKTTRVETTTVERVIPAADAPAVETDDQPEPPPEAESALAPGAMHVDAPQAPPDNPDVEAQAADEFSHHEAVNEIPPPEAMSALAPGAMHVDVPQAPPENANPEADPNANG
jgi:hypothetical protein